MVASFTNTRQNDVPLLTPLRYRKYIPKKTNPHVIGRPGQFASSFGVLTFARNFYLVFATLCNDTQIKVVTTLII